VRLEVDLDHLGQLEQRLDAGLAGEPVDRDGVPLLDEASAALDQLGIAAEVGGDVQHRAMGGWRDRGRPVEHPRPGLAVDLQVADQAADVDGHVAEQIRDRHRLVCGVRRGGLRLRRGAVHELERDDRVVDAHDGLPGHQSVHGRRRLVRVLCHGHPTFAVAWWTWVPIGRSAPRLSRSGPRAKVG